MQAATPPKCRRSFNTRWISGFVKDSKGNLIPPHYIEVIEFEHAGKAVFRAFWGPAVSKDPYIKFSFKGGKKGDDLTISWVDNKGQSDSLYREDFSKAVP